LVTFYPKHKNYGFDFTFTIYESDGATPKVLTDYTLTFKMWKRGSRVVKVSSACAITDAANGVCTYTVAINDLDTIGEFEAEVELTKAGIIEDTDPFYITVEPSNPS
jgi:hypothetical protein